MSKDFSHLRRWITGEGYPADCPSRPVILECIPSRSGASMTVYDRGERIFTVNGCGFDRHGVALAIFLESQFRPELLSAARQRFCTMPVQEWRRVGNFPGFEYNPVKDRFSLTGEAGLTSMSEIASIIHLKVTRSESKAGTLLIIEKRS